MADLNTADIMVTGADQQADDGAVSGGDGGLWAFIGMGAGALIAIAVLSVRVFRTL